MSPLGIAAIIPNSYRYSRTYPSAMICAGRHCELDLLATLVDFFYMELGTFGKHTLLTGAGFSRNWGGYTAPEMMQQILNYLEENEEARVFWLEVSSFEEGLARARAGEVSPDALQHIEDTILKVFKSLDRQLQGSNGPWFHGIEKLLSQFYWRAPSGVEVDTG